MRFAPDSLHIVGSDLVLVLARRKNKLRGSRLVRSCWCSSSPGFCPLHSVQPLMEAAGDDFAPFASITPAKALQVLRNILVDLEVHRAAEYRLHDLRRGHALDLQQSGAPLYEILAAGEWRSPAFLEYLDKNQLETDMVVQAHCAESDDDGGF